MPAAPGPYALAGVEMPTWLIRFDRYGACASPSTRAALFEGLGSGAATDVILFSHGWNDDFADATDMYAAFLRNFEALQRAHRAGRNFRPLFVGALWPSIWLSFDQGPDIASGGPGGDGQAQALLAELAGRIAASGGAAGLERVYSLLAGPSLDDAEAAELAQLIAPAFGVIADEGAALNGRDTVATDVLAMMRAMEAAGPGGGRPAQSDDIDEFSRPTDAGDSGALPVGPRAAGLPGWLDPRTALRLFSLYQMKDRAGTVGFNGVASFLRELLAVAGSGPGATQPRVHAVGHSFGCKVLLSAICAQPLPRPLASLLLLQPAISHLCFADKVAETGRPGGYRAALSAERVAPPIFSTYTRQDMPLHDAFHLAVRREGDLGEMQIAGDNESTTAGPPPSRFAALGGYGPRQANQVLVDPLPRAGSAISLPPGSVPIVAFDGSQDMIHGHGDITGPALAWALHQLVFR
uniref:Alpha/beta hydrolase n=1 Tax=uncultured bacterium EC5 TaxID=672206 RepID=G4WV78_9BACT|nr:hypothetical protein [uncultured bacterium EC5]